VRDLEPVSMQLFLKVLFGNRSLFASKFRNRKIVYSLIGMTSIHKISVLL